MVGEGCRVVQGFWMQMKRGAKGTWLRVGVFPLRTMRKGVKTRGFMCGGQCDSSVVRRYSYKLFSLYALFRDGPTCLHRHGSLSSGSRVSAVFVGPIWFTKFEKGKIAAICVPGS